MTEEFPFTTPADSDARMFIQWNGTYLCMDFDCRCGASGHVDKDFVYCVHCPVCDTYYEMGTQVVVKVCDKPDHSCVAELEETE